MEKAIGRFHVLTDYHFQQRFSHAELAGMAIDGGADTIQFRQKAGGIRHVLMEAQETADVCRARSIPFIVNDRVDVAVGSAAEGVHLGQTDFPIRVARRILGREAIIGGTATTLDQALFVQEEGGDYVGFGPIFETGSKRNPTSVKGLTKLNIVCSKLNIPVIAIAGITPARVGGVIEAGAHGVAVMTAISLAPDPASAAKDVRSALDDALNPSRIVGPSHSRA